MLADLTFASRSHTCLYFPKTDIGPSSVVNLKFSIHPLSHDNIGNRVRLTGQYIPLHTPMYTNPILNRERELKSPVDGRFRESINTSTICLLGGTVMTSLVTFSAGISNRQFPRRLRHLANVRLRVAFNRAH